MAPRKRARDEMESSEPPKEMSLLERIRNMWEFASTMQFIFMFGKIMKIDEDFDIEDFETECLKPGNSDKLEDIGLSLLKWISSHRGLNLEIWDEYTRRQYLAKAPQLNPYGDDEEPKKFRNFDIFQKIRILHQLTVWTFWNPDRIRERMPEHQKETDQLEWRIEELGYDADERQYYLLDDNRLYRRTDPPPPPLPRSKPKSNTLKAQAARRRASKRRRVDDSETPDDRSSMAIESEGEPNGTDAEVDVKPSDGDTFSGYKWECLAITLAQYQDLCESLRKSKDPNEKTLRSRLLEEVIPIIEAAEEKQRRKIERRERELLALEKMATAKRSSRLADKHDRERHEKEAAEAEQKRAGDLAEAHRLQKQQERMDRERQSRMMTREQRIKDREYKRLLMEEELAKAAEDAMKVESGLVRGSERHLKEKMERAKKEIEELAAEEEWTFDCSGCGVHGKNLDDGSHSVACEKCNVWQHSKCLGISKAAAEKEDFHFICRDCRRPKEEKKPKISLKFRTGVSSSPTQPSTETRISQSPVKQKFAGIHVPKIRASDRPSSQDGQGVVQTPQGPKSPAQQNGYLYYTAAPPQLASPPQYQSFPNGHQQTYPRPTSSHSSPPNAPCSPPLLQNGFSHRSGQQSGETTVPALHSNSSSYTNSSAHHTYSHGQFPPNFNGVQHQYQPYASGTQATPLPIAPRIPSAQRNSNPNMSIAGDRMPSPILNRPTISPTQGNFDVGLVAGVPQRSPPPNPQATFRTPAHTNAPSPVLNQSANGSHFRITPPTLSYQPNPPYLSGISPTKRSPSLEISANMQHVPGSSPPPQPNLPMRSVSGTPIFPPAEKLGPSREQLSKSPMPTPSKQMTAAQVGEEELKRVSEQVRQNVEPRRLEEA